METVDDDDQPADGELDEDTGDDEALKKAGYERLDGSEGMPRDDDEEELEGGYASDEDETDGMQHLRAAMKSTKLGSNLEEGAAKLSKDEEWSSTQMTRWWKKMWRESMTDDEKTAFDQNIIYTMYICALNAGRDYTEEDLAADRQFCLERALRLLNRQRFGKRDAALQVVPQLNYTGLGDDENSKVEAEVLGEADEDLHRQCKELKDLCISKGLDPNSLPKKPAKTQKQVEEEHARLLLRRIAFADARATLKLRRSPREQGDVVKMRSALFTGSNDGNDRVHGADKILRQPYPLLEAAICGRASAMMKDRPDAEVRDFIVHSQLGAYVSDDESDRGSGGSS